MEVQEMIDALKELGYSVYPPLSDKQDEEASKCAETGYGECMKCSCFICRAGIE